MTRIMEEYRESLEVEIKKKKEEIDPEIQNYKDLVNSLLKVQKRFKKTPLKQHSLPLNGNLYNGKQIQHFCE
jgi:3-methyladenine DNA glycosylase/8-oxoguanine DNA glycosylase